MTTRRRMAPPVHPALLKHQELRGKSLQNRVADRITEFAGSMTFVVVHVIWFGLWIGLRLEKFPFGLLTMMVSLEAIFLSTFLLISQNRADEKRQLLADSEWKLVQEQGRENQLEVKQNEELLSLTRRVLELTEAVHRATAMERP